ncbi:class I SAM-dependent methyltransferase [Neobacillus sp. D3-1R]|uniref:class I SAM-dependent methyltransferase n=1 Tax=Neobacillus sp. D3-1R TaxID=3445778 RepID=UPI003FA05D87
MERTFANWYDLIMNPLEKNKFLEIRKKLLSKAKGKVLEIGAGTGINFPLYKQADSVIAIEPNPYMIKQSSAKMKLATIPIEVIQTGAEHLPFQDHHFDSIVATLVFCTIPDGEKAIKEIQRVCKPGGNILLFEHVIMENHLLASMQNLFTPAWKKVAGGCCLNKDTVKLLRDHQIEILNIEKYFNGMFLSIEAKNSIH